MTRGPDFSLDDLIKEQEERENRENGSDEGLATTAGRVPVGVVEKYFQGIGVAAIKLTGRIEIGDIIEIGTMENAIRQKVESMQINRKDVASAGAGDSVGIKVRCKVDENEPVYKLPPMRGEA